VDSSEKEKNTKILKKKIEQNNNNVIELSPATGSRGYPSQKIAIMSFLYYLNLSKIIIIVKNTKLLELVSLNVMQLVNKICRPFKWCPL
jgi:hypothetical protein